MNIILVTLLTVLIALTYFVVLAKLNGESISFSKYKKVVVTYNAGILIFLLFGLICLISIQLIFFEFNKTNLNTLNLNLITDFIGLGTATYIVGQLLKKDEKQKEQKRIKEKAKTMIQFSMDLMNNTISRNYVHFVTQKPTNMTTDSEADTEKLISDLGHIIENIDIYITNDFFKGDVEVIRYDNQQIDFDTRISSEFWARTAFIAHFKKKAQTDISNFISKHISILPQDLLQSYFTIENILNGNSFVDLGELISNHYQTRNILISDIGLITMQEDYAKLGKELSFILSYFKE